MKAISNSAECPKCGVGHKSKPFCTFDNGYYCFSCGLSKGYDRAWIFRDRLKATIKLPEDATQDVSMFSVECLLWLGQYNIYKEDLYSSNIMYCCSDDSVLFLNVQNKEIIGWQSRRIGKRYITTRGDKLPMLFECASSLRTLVIVEDFISAWRVSKQYNSLCLFGTKLKHQEASKLIRSYDNIYVWLDNDKDKELNSGQEAAVEIKKTLDSCLRWENRRKSWNKFNVNIINIVSEKDPKCYLDNEIKAFVGEAYVIKQ